MQVAKVIYSPFKLSTQAGRIGLLCGLTAGTVTRDEVEAAVLQDTEKRPYRKPVVAYGRRYNSITEAAAANCSSTATLNQLKAEQAFIRKLCNADNVEGFYWSE